MNNPIVIASRYINGRYHELLALDRPHHAYIVAVNGGIPSARRKLTQAEARAWYDVASRKQGSRP